MLFSERYGYKKIKMLKKDEMPDSLRNRLWNTIYDAFFIYLDDQTPDWVLTNMSEYKISRDIWLSFLNGDKYIFHKGPLSAVVDEINKKYHQLQWHEVYEFIEFILQNCAVGKKKMKLIEKIRLIFKQEKASYDIIGDRICPPLGDEEMKKEVGKTLNIPNKYKSVSGHFSKALELFSKRPEADYENSIKESISAVDLLVQIILGKEGTLGKLVDSLDIHPALKRAFSNLYGWTSDDAGIRHPKSKEPLSCDEPEARYMLVTCSAFINYVTAKHETKQ